MVTASPYIHVSIHHVVHLKLMQYYMPVISQQRKRKKDRNNSSSLLEVKVRHILATNQFAGFVIKNTMTESLVLGTLD